MDDLSLNKHIKYNPPCVRKKTNFSAPSHLNLVDASTVEILEENVDYFNENIQYISPKLNTLFEKIDKLDNDDMDKYGKVFKHFIFTDVRSNLYGAKIIGSGFINKGFNLGFNAERINSKKKFKKIQLISNSLLADTEYDNFYLFQYVKIFLL